MYSGHICGKLYGFYSLVCDNDQFMLFEFIVIFIIRIRIHLFQVKTLIQLVHILAHLSRYNTSNMLTK